jgi:asparagine synthase (glutamine-hydrolysing)
VAEAYKTQHHELLMDIPVGEMLERMAEVYDEPFADSSNIPTYLVAKFARQHVKVVLSGDGADEIFGGYEWYRTLVNDDKIDVRFASRTCLWLRALLFRFLRRTGLPLEQQKNAAFQAYRQALLKSRYPDLWERHLANSTSLKCSRQSLWNGRTLPETEKSLRSAYWPAPGSEGLDRAVDFDVRCYLPGDILVKVDRAAMAHGLETRAPFLDVDLVEFVLNLAAELRFRDNSLKFLLRETCSNLWPEKVRTRPKQGFGAPIWNWLQRPDVRALIRRLTAPSHPLNTLLPGAATIAKGSDSQLSWTLLCLGLWLEKRPTCLNNLS